MLTGTRSLEENDLANLAKRSLLQQGDIIVYKRRFSTGACVLKELLV